MSDASYTLPGNFEAAFRKSNATARRRMLRDLMNAVSAAETTLTGGWRPVLSRLASLARVEGAPSQADTLVGILAATDAPCVVPAPDAPVWCPHCTGVYPFARFGVRNARRTPDAVRFDAPSAAPEGFRLGWVLRGGVEEPPTDAALSALADGWRPATDRNHGNVVAVLDATRRPDGTVAGFSVRTASRQSNCSKCRAADPDTRAAHKGAPWDGSAFHP